MTQTETTCCPTCGRPTVETPTDHAARLRTTHTLTPRQSDVLDAVARYREAFSLSPTLQEIADDLGISKVSVFEHVGAHASPAWAAAVGLIVMRKAGAA